MMIQHIPCKQTLVCHVAVESNLYLSYTTVLLHCIHIVMTRVVCRPFILMNSFDCHGSSYNSSHYCIDAIKHYSCISKIQITLYCNMTNQSLFARYVLYHQLYKDGSLMLFGCFWCLEALIYEYIILIYKKYYRCNRL